MPNFVTNVDREKENRTTPRLTTWILVSLLMELFNAVEFYFLFHSVLGISVELLQLPFLLVSLLTFLLGPAMYWARKEDFKRGVEVRTVLVVDIGIFAWAGVILYVLRKAELLPAFDIYAYILLFIGATSGILIALFRKRIVRSP